MHYSIRIWNGTVKTNLLQEQWAALKQVMWQVGELQPKTHLVNFLDMLHEIKYQLWIWNPIELFQIFLRWVWMKIITSSFSTAKSLKWYQLN